MCGIVGLFSKSPEIESNLGKYLSQMLIEMSERGPDSSGVAIYRTPTDKSHFKITLIAPDEAYDWSKLADDLSKIFAQPVDYEVRANQATYVIPQREEKLRDWFFENHPSLKLLSSGKSIEIYKSLGLPSRVIENFNIHELTGTHALGHSRMATESAVTVQHSHPFSTGEDLCLVHNGSLSNHNRLRRKLIKKGIVFHTDNDSEVAAGYITSRLIDGDDLDEALAAAVYDLDGFYTFAVGTKDGFAVMRDPIACKPAVIAETDSWVAMASEYRALAVLPEAENADCWEPVPSKIYSWKH
ncbi:MAG: amidophosphoribosyltransferase [Pseudomonadota bacterium]